LTGRYYAQTSTADWITLHNEKFSTCIPIEPDKKFNVMAQSFFNVYSLGAVTNKDVWLYNSSRRKLKENITNMVNYYNTQRKELNSARKPQH
jgi:predicted helicase